MTKEKNPKKPLKARLWKWCKVLLFTGVILITLGALILAEENWRAERAWKKMQQEIADRGEPLAWAELVGPPVPDDENFAMSPLFRPLVNLRKAGYTTKTLDNNFPIEVGVIEWSDPEGVENASPNLPIFPSYQKDGRVDMAALRQSFAESEEFELPENSTTAAQDVLFALQKLDQKFAAVMEASHRPHLDFLEDEKSIYSGDALGQLSILKSWGQAFRIKACAQLATANPNDAYESVMTMFRMAELLEQEPLLISYLVANAINHMAANAFWLGWADHRWEEEQLELFQEYFSSRDVRQVAPKTLIGERTLSNMLHLNFSPESEATESSSFNIFARLIMTHNKVTIYRVYNSVIDDVNKLLESRTPLFQADKDYLKLSGIDGFHPYSVIASATVSGVVPALQKFDRAQVIIDLAATVCALERYWLDNDEYPEALADLVPEYLSEVPIDLMSGEPFHYSKRDDGWFDLYSVGMNQVDDDGFFTNKGRDNEDKIDYPWPLPIPQPEGRLF